jgi:hypothetical protein
MWEKFDEDFSRMGSTSLTSSMKSSETSKASKISDAAERIINTDKMMGSDKMMSSDMMNTERSLFPSSFSRLPSIFSRDLDNSEFPKFKDDQVTFFYFEPCVQRNLLDSRMMHYVD